MEERRGESSDVWMEKAGDDVKAFFQSLGIDPDLSDSAKVTRQAELRAGAEQTAEEYQAALDYHNGRTSDVFHTLLKHRLGQESFFTKQEALDEAVKVAEECDAMGIDPTWDLPARVARLQDIHQGSPLMHEERKRKESTLV